MRISRRKPMEHDTERSERTVASRLTDSSRRRFLAASALFGAGAFGATSPAVADDHDDDEYDDEDDEEADGDGHDHDGDDMEDDHEEFSLQMIVDDPEAYYVDIHTEAFPQGSVRGQLEGEPGTTEFWVTATPDEVPDEEGGGESEATAQFDLVLDPDDEVICFDICARGVTPPYESPANTSTHIHVGEPGEVGPPVVVFPDPQPRDPDADGPRTSSGCLPDELAFMTGVE
jgi:hypothetical protein